MSMSQISAPTGRHTASQPPLGAVARLLSEPVNAILALVLVALIGLGGAVATWGLVALTMAALPMVPVIFALLILVTFG
jgi:hypothetical protein